MQTQTRGFFGIGVEGLSKPVNAGNLFRCAQGFGASFLFTIGASYARRDAPTDTSNAGGQIPLYEFGSAEELRLPEGCQLVGLELLDDAIELPTFCHPRRAAYVLGPERGSLSPALVARCDFVVKIPTAFAINVAVAGAIAMYDRMASLRRFAERPLFPGGPPAPLPEHVFGRPIRRRGRHKAKPTALSLFAALLLAATGAAAQQPPAKPLGTFQSWTAYEATIDKKKTCYVYAVPAKSEGKYTTRGPTYIQVTHRPGDKATNEVSVTAGYTYKDKAAVELDVGKQKFELFTNGDGAWAVDAKTDAAIVKAMAAGASLVVKGASSRGTVTTDTYPLAGFSAAYAEIGKACGVKG